MKQLAGEYRTLDHLSALKTTEPNDLSSASTSIYITGHARTTNYTLINHLQTTHTESSRSRTSTAHDDRLTARSSDDKADIIRQNTTHFTEPKHSHWRLVHSCPAMTSAWRHWLDVDWLLSTAAVCPADEQSTGMLVMREIIQFVKLLFLTELIVMRCGWSNSIHRQFCWHFMWTLF